MATKREYLVNLGLAKPTRGKFTKEALAALDKAIAEGVVFDEPAKPTPKPRVKVAKPDAEDKVQRAPSPLDMPRRRPENSGFSVVGNILVRQDLCGNCKIQVAKCACKSGPRAHAFLEKENGGPLPLTLDKPLV